MDGATLQAKVFAGYAKAAQRVGLPFNLYRPTSASNPIAAGTLLQSVNAAFTVHSGKNFEFGQVSDYDRPLFHALLDPTLVKVGDYLQSTAAEPTQGPFFIVQITPSMPVLACACNRTVTVATPGPAHTAGVSGYGGTTRGNETPILTAWPASLLQRRVTSTREKLPIDGGQPLFRLLLPAFPGTSIRLGNIVTDDLGNRYVVSMVEKQDLGWRCDVQSAIL